jgi:hypothetical protein
MSSLPQWPPPDDDPRHLEIMQERVRRIVNEAAQAVADGIVEEVGKIFLEAKTGTFDLRQRITAIEQAIEKLKKARS